MASLTQWTWVWVNSGSWWWTGKPGVLQSVHGFTKNRTQTEWLNWLITWPKYWSFSFSISPSNEHSGLISFRMDWLDLLAVLGTLKSILQHHNLKASILGCSAFFMVQLSPPYMTTGKTIGLTRQTFVGKVTSLLLNMLSRLVITFLPRSENEREVAQSCPTLCDLVDCQGPVSFTIS